ncbi:MAG: hypothetical protein HYY37_06300 [Candidatus Aenigmarchaeota archaeon]|nr:hypothetical protein [Candidatus Aenigmarchaeota archaeon]
MARIFPYVADNTQDTVELIRRPVDAGSGYASARMESLYPGLGNGEVYVPPLLAAHAPYSGTVVAQRDGGRACITGREVTFDLSRLGFTEEPILQQFRESRKGVGTKTGQLPLDPILGYRGSMERIKSYVKSKLPPDSELFHIVLTPSGDRRPPFRRLVGNPAYPDWVYRMRDMAHGYVPDVRIHDENIITLHDHGFGRPSGAQRYSFAHGSVDVTDELIGDSGGIKIAPVTHAYPYPEAVAEAIRHMPHDRRSVDPAMRMGQECRYLPSGLRAERITNPYAYNIPGNPLAVLSNDRDERAAMLEVLYRDLPPYLSIYSRYFNGRGSTFSIPRIGDVDLRYANPSSFQSNVKPFFIVKDLVVAPTGAYFVDLESIRLREPCPPEEFDTRFNMYAACVLRDFFGLFYYSQLLNNGPLTLADLPSNSSPYLQQSPDGTLEKMAAVINQSPQLEAQRADDGGIEVSIYTKDGWLTTTVPMNQIVPGHLLRN